MFNINNTLIRYLFTFVILLTFFFPTLLDYYVNSERITLWEPDDSEHYILKKTQLKNCLINDCQFNKSADHFIQNKLLTDEIIIKRTVLDYHPAFSAILLLLEQVFWDQYTSFQVLNYISSLLLIYFSYFFFNNYFKDKLNIKNKIILFIIFFIFLTHINLIWRDAFKLNFGIFIFLIDKLINFPLQKKDIKFYFFNIFQVFIHPAGIICFLIINFLIFFNSLNFKFNISYLKKNFKQSLYLLISTLLVIIYYFNSFKYVSSDISIYNIITGNYYNGIKINFLNIKNYFFSFNGLFLIIIFINLLYIKKFNYLAITISLIIFFHIFNPSPLKNIVEIFDFFFKFVSITLLFEIFLKKPNIITFSTVFLITIFQFYDLSKNLHNFLKVRPIIDNINYSNYNLYKNIFFTETDKKILFDGSNDYILYKHLNNGLINRKIYYTGFSNSKIEDFFFKKDEFYIVFDLFNSSFYLSNPISIKSQNNNRDQSVLKHLKSRSVSKYLKTNDHLQILNNENQEYYLKLNSYSKGTILVNDKEIDIKENQILKIKLKKNSLTRISIENINKYVQLEGILLNDSAKLNFPWKKNIHLKINDRFINKTIVVNFNNLNINEKCKIIEIYFDKFQDIYAKGICK
jgi:hypothetical protein